MEWLTAGLAVAAAGMTLLSAALTAALTAVREIDGSKARIMAGEGFAGADALSAIRAGDVATSPLSVLRTLCCLGAVATGLAAALGGWGPGAVGWAAPTLVLVVLLAGDVVPRGLGSRRPVRLALVAAPFLRRASRLFRWLVLPLRLLERLPRRDETDGDASSDEMHVREALAIGTGEGVVEAEEHRLVERAFQLDERDAWDAMTPRVDIFAWKDSALLSEIVPELVAVPHSRVPVYGENIDDVTGILHVREAYGAYVAGQRDVPLSRFAREPMFVPGSLSLAKLLAEFRARRVHMGIVADEFGGTDGLITLEDVLEELVGEIVDETDVDEEPLVRVSGGEFVASGAAEIRGINDAFGSDLPAGEHRSLNGFILEELGEVPDAGASIEAGGIRIEVLEASETQVLRARLLRLRRPKATDDG